MNAKLSIVKGKLYIQMEAVIRVPLILDFNSRTIDAKIHLSNRQRQILEGLHKFLSNKEIAKNIGISESTVKFYVSKLLKKFGARSRAELLDICRREPQRSE